MINNVYRYVFLDGIRGVAALAVVIYHATQYTSRPILPMAPLAVDLFFCLSGFVIAYSYEERLKANIINTNRYVTKRIIRLYPLFVLGICLGTITITLQVVNRELELLNIKSIMLAFLLNIVFIPYFREIVGLNGHIIESSLYPSNSPAWSLFFELFAYIIFIPLTKLKTNNLIGIVAAAFVIYSALVLYYGHGLGWSDRGFIGGFPRVIYGFFSGVIVYRTSWGHEQTNKIRRTKELFERLSIAVALILILVLMVCWSINVSQTRILTVVLLPLGPAVVFIGSFVRLRPVFSKLCGVMGWLSYPIYCLHFPLLVAIGEGAKINMFYYVSENGKIVVTVGIIFVVSAGIAFYVDGPIRKWLSFQLERR